MAPKAKGPGGEDPKLQAALKKLQVEPVSGIEEINMFKEDGNVLHFSAPKGKYIRDISQTRTVSSTWMSPFQSRLHSLIRCMAMARTQGSRWRKHDRNVLSQMERKPNGKERLPSALEADKCVQSASLARIDSVGFAALHRSIGSSDNAAHFLSRALR